jgi:hypothetical protein
MRELTLKTAILVTFTLTLLLAAKGQAAAAIDQKATAFVLCKSQKNVRTIRILPEKAESCTITYSKGGNEEVVGANRSLRTCKSILKSIQTNLESAKWNCRNVETAHLTTSGEAL